MYNFLLVFHYNYVSALHRFQDIITYFPKFEDDHEHVAFGGNLSSVQ